MNISRDNGIDVDWREESFAPEIIMRVDHVTTHFVETETGLEIFGCDKKSRPIQDLWARKRLGKFCKANVKSIAGIKSSNI